MKFCGKLAFFGVLISGTTAKLVDIPTDIYLIYPPGKVNLKQNVMVGFETSTVGAAPVDRNISVSVQDSQGIRRAFVLSSGIQPNCSSILSAIPDQGPVVIGGNIWEAGIYTILWNYTYAFSSDPFQANATSCGPGPYSVQQIMFNKSFEIADLGQDVTNPTTTLTTSLPTAPTGKVNIPDPTTSTSTTVTMKSPSTTPSLDSSKGSASALQGSGVALIGCAVLGVLFCFV